jgi:ActR/RegA family two-component response regulator
LIIEPDRRTVDELQEHFERHGYEAEIALSVSVGLSILAERRMDVAIIDAHLKVEAQAKEEEWALLRSLREADPDLPVVVINGRKGKGVGKVARRAGAARFLPSPVDAEAIMLALSDVLRN